MSIYAHSRKFHIPLRYQCHGFQRKAQKPIFTALFGGREGDILGTGLLKSGPSRERRGCVIFPQFRFVYFSFCGNDVVLLPQTIQGRKKRSFRAGWMKRFSVLSFSLSYLFFIPFLMPAPPMCAWKSRASQKELQYSPK